MSHLSHVCGQQGLQFLHDKQTQGADWAGHLLQTGQADQQEQEFKFHFHIHIRFLMLTWSPVAVPSSDVETSLLAESWGSFCSSSFLLEAQSPNSTHVSPGFCAHTYYLALDVEQKCSIQRRTDRGWTHQVTRALLQEFWQMHLHLWVAIWDALAFWEALAQSMQGFIDSLLQENGSQHVVDTCVENVFFYTNRHSATATLTFLRYYREDNICRVWRPAHVVSRRGSKSERKKYAGGDSTTSSPSCPCWRSCWWTDGRPGCTLNTCPQSDEQKTQWDNEPEEVIPVCVRRCEWDLQIQLRVYISAAGPCECVMHRLTRDLCLKTDRGSMMNLESP